MAHARPLNPYGILKREEERKKKKTDSIDFQTRTENFAKLSTWKFSSK